MRIVAGRFRGHHLAPVPRRGVRPTADPVREALFNILGARVIDAAFLDLAAGTGAVGLEALSRGAAPVYLVEHDAAALRVIRRNLELLRIDLAVDDLHVVPSDVGAWLAGPLKASLGQTIGVAFLDPPYGDPRLPRWIERIARSDLLDDESLVVVEHRTGDPPEFPGLDVRWTRRYGDTSLTAAGPGEGRRGTGEDAEKADIA